MENEMELIHSLGEAEAIAKIMIMNNDIDGLYGLRDIVLGGSIKGTSDEFHNFCVNYAARGDYESACNLLDIGLKQHSHSTDLLADFLQYGIKCGRQSECKTYYERLLSISRNYWTWRSFDFSIDYLKAAATELHNTKKFEKTKNELLSLVEDFQNQMPFSEQPFLAKSEIYDFLGMHSEAVKALEDGVKSKRICPKCCLRYSDLMIKQGRYDVVLETTKKGIIASAQEQATINIGYLFYLSGLAKDALIHENENYNDETQILDVYTDYKIASELLDKSRVEYLQMIKQRTLILELKSGITFKTSEKNEKLLMLGDSSKIEDKKP